MLLESSSERNEPRDYSSDIDQILREFLSDSVLRKRIAGFARRRKFHMSWGIHGFKGFRYLSNCPPSTEKNPEFKALLQL